MTSIPLVALVGNPNAGKSALFNMLTGARQKVGNYPGVTVERKSGRLWLPDGRPVELVDLPGAYSLEPSSPAWQFEERRTWLPALGAPAPVGSDLSARISGRKPVGKTAMLWPR